MTGREVCELVSGSDDNVELIGDENAAAYDWVAINMEDCNYSENGERPNALVIVCDEGRYVCVMRGLVKVSFATLFPTSIKSVFGGRLADVITVRGE